MITADNLWLARRYMGVSAKRLAEAIEVTPQFISLIETGKCPLPYERARQIQTALGLDAERMRIIQASYDRLREGNT